MKNIVTEEQIIIRKIEQLHHKPFDKDIAKSAISKLIALGYKRNNDAEKFHAKTVVLENGNRRIKIGCLRNQFYIDVTKLYQTYRFETLNPFSQWNECLSWSGD